MKSIVNVLLVLCLSVNFVVLKAAEPLKEVKDSCITANVSFKTDVAPVMTNSCIKCHNNNRATAGVNLEGYDNVMKLAHSGMLKKVIEHQQGVAAMPMMASKLPDCVIKKINAWTDQGMKDN